LHYVGLGANRSFAHHMFSTTCVEGAPYVVKRAPAALPWVTLS
jgi:hypothetical protein